MTSKKGATHRFLSKLPTDLQGFDEISHGGVPRRRTSLVMGGPGTGKTIFALQALVNAARARKQSGIFVAFEEGTREIFANAATFGWGLPTLAKGALFFLDARLSPTVVQSGDFELSGMLAILEAKKQELAADWIVFDGIDVLLALLQNPGAEVREIYRLRDWLAHSDLTALITAKMDGDTSSPAYYGFTQFMADCVIRFDRRLEQGISVRRLGITKYRGSAFASGEFSLSFGPHGMEVVAPAKAETLHEASTERVSSGFEGLDSMLGGGVFRGTSTLITGAPGTSKTTLAGQFAESACRRGERTLFVSFDEGGERIRRNLTSVGIHLDAYVKSGLLRMYSGRTDATNAEEGRRSAGRGDRAADLDDCGYLDPSVVSGPRRRTQPRAYHRQVTRHATLEPGTRARAERRGAGAGGCLLLGRRGADGHVALGKGGRRAGPKTEAARGIHSETP